MASNICAGGRLGKLESPAVTENHLDRGIYPESFRNVTDATDNFTPFPSFPLNLKRKILLALSLDDIIHFSQADREGNLLLNDLLTTSWKRIKDEASLKVGVFLPHLKIMNDLRLKPLSETIQSEEWRGSSVRMLLDPSIQFSEIPAGLFRMGSEANFNEPNYDPGGYENEVPTWVQLGKDGIQIKIQRTSVTQLLWYLVMGNNPSHFIKEAHCPEDHMFSGEITLCPRNPVERISWDQIAEREKDESGREAREYKVGTFLRTLKDRFGIEARLPTEAERERATRGAATQEEMLDLSSHFYRPYYFGAMGENNTNLNAHVWWDGNSRRRTHRVGSKGWNSLGLADISGNVLEWVEDWYSSRYPTAITPDQTLHNPQGPESGSGRVFRGSSWAHTNPRVFRSAYRGSCYRGIGYHSVGFRLLIEVPLVR